MGYKILNNPIQCFFENPNIEVKYIYIIDQTRSYNKDKN